MECSVLFKIVILRLYWGNPYLFFSEGEYHKLFVILMIKGRTASTQLSLPNSAPFSTSPCIIGNILVFLCIKQRACVTSYFVFSIAVLPHRHGIVYYHLILYTRDQHFWGAPSLFEKESGLFLCI